VISEITVEDDALFECQVGATEHSPGLVSRKAKLTVQGYHQRCLIYSYLILHCPGCEVDICVGMAKAGIQWVPWDSHGNWN